MSEWREYREIEEIERRLSSIERKIDQLLQVLVPTAATGGQISQIIEGATMPITGIKVGGNGVFQVAWNGGMDPSKQPVWTSPTDTGITFAPVPTDPTGNTVTVQDAVLDANTTFDLLVTGVASDQSTVTATAKGVPLAQAPATAGVISQLS